MKRFVINVVLVILPICLTVSLFNLIVDPGRLYGDGGYENQLAKMLIESKRNVTNVDINISERVFKKILCTNYPDNIDVLVLGSSRVMLISSDCFYGKKVLNLGVSSGTIEDECALMYTCIHSGLKPSLVLLGVEPFYFNANMKDERTKEIQEQYDGFLKEVGQRGSRMFGFDWAKWANLFSLSYFQQGIEKLRLEKRRLVVTDKLENEWRTYHYDGSFAYQEEMNQRSIEEVNEIAKSYTNYQWNNFDEISLERAKSLITLIDYIRSQNADVIVFTAPYHPITYDRFMNQYEFRQVKNAERLLERIVKDKGVKVIGNWNPSVCGCDETDFYDAGHMKVKGLDKIFGECLK